MRLTRTRTPPAIIRLPICFLPFWIVGFAYNLDMMLSLLSVGAPGGSPSAATLRRKELENHEKGTGNSHVSNRMGRHVCRDACYAICQVVAAMLHRRPRGTNR